MTLVAQFEKNMGFTVHLGRNHCIKNIIKLLHALRSKQEVSTSNQVIKLLHKCIKGIFSKNQGDVDRFRENLQALIPDQFGDHSYCHARFCGYKQVENLEKYCHRSLPYKAPLNNPILREKLNEPIIAKSAMYVDLGSSRAYEHACSYAQSP